MLPTDTYFTKTKDIYFNGEGIQLVHVPAARYDAIVPALLDIGNLDGVLVTVPFKARMLRFATHLGPTAQCIGALNALAPGPTATDMFLDDRQQTSLEQLNDVYVLVNLVVDLLYTVFDPRIRY